MAAEQVYSLIYYLMFVFALAIGLAALSMNPWGRANKHFYVLCMGIAAWTFGYAISNIAVDIDVAIFWRKLSIIGRTMVHAFLLHMVFIITNRYEGLRLWYRLAIYLPGLVLLYAMVLSPHGYLNANNFIHIDIGWVYVSNFNIWDIFYAIYFLSYMIISFYLIRTWRRSLSDEREVRSAKLLCYTFMISIFPGIAIDYAMNIFYGAKSMQIGALLTLLPVTAIFLLTRRSRLQPDRRFKDLDIILTEENRLKLYFLTATIFFVGAVLNSMQYFFTNFMYSQERSHHALQVSILLFAIGFFIVAVQYIKYKRLRDLLVHTIVLSSIPLVTMAYIETASITVWVFPFVILLMALAFDNSKPLLAVTLVAVVTQFLVWSQVSGEAIIMDEIDFLLRAGLFILAFAVGIMINRIYIKKIKENSSYMDYHQLISDLSYKFVNVTQDDFRLNMNELLARVSEYFAVDRSYIIIYSEEIGGGVFHFEWVRPGIPSHGDMLAYMASRRGSSWSTRNIEQQRVNIVEDVYGLPPEAQRDREWMIANGVQSIIGVQIGVSDKVMAYIACESILKPKIWVKEDIELMKITSNLISSALVKLEREYKIEYLAYYDQLTGLLNRTMFKDRTNQAILNASRLGKTMAVVFMDLDGFKLVNDTIGHSGGDKLLREVAQKLEKSVRSTDIVARFAGDEFVITLTNINHIDDARNIVTKIRESFSENFNIDGQDFYVTASMGITYYEDGDDVDSLIRRADKAMYKAKNQGRNKYAFYRIEDE